MKTLKELIVKHVKERGNNADLNDIDTSEVTDMESLFTSVTFNGDISAWNVSNVTTMKMMFYRSIFNGDISGWDVSNVTNMGSMFSHSKFDGDISDWDVSKVKHTLDFIISNSKLEKNPPKWIKK